MWELVGQPQIIHDVIRLGENYIREAEVRPAGNFKDFIKWWARHPNYSRDLFLVCWSSVHLWHRQMHLHPRKNRTPPHHMCLSISYMTVFSSLLHDSFSFTLWSSVVQCCLLASGKEDNQVTSHGFILPLLCRCCYFKPVFLLLWWLC